MNFNFNFNNKIIIIARITFFSFAAQHNGTYIEQINKHGSRAMPMLPAHHRIFNSNTTRWRWDEFMFGHLPYSRPVYVSIDGLSMHPKMRKVIEHDFWIVYCCDRNWNAKSNNSRLSLQPIIFNEQLFGREKNTMAEYVIAVRRDRNRVDAIINWPPLFPMCWTNFTLECVKRRKRKCFLFVSTSVERR